MSRRPEFKFPATTRWFTNVSTAAECSYIKKRNKSFLKKKLVRWKKTPTDPGLVTETLQESCRSSPKKRPELNGGLTMGTGWVVQESPLQTEGVCRGTLQSTAQMVTVRRGARGLV